MYATSLHLVLIAAAVPTADVRTRSRDRACIPAKHDEVAIGDAAVDRTASEVTGTVRVSVGVQLHRTTHRRHAARGGGART